MSVHFNNHSGQLTFLSPHRFLPTASVSTDNTRRVTARGCALRLSLPNYYKKQLFLHPKINFKTHYKNTNLLGIAKRNDKRVDVKFFQPVSQIGPYRAKCRHYFRWQAKYKDLFWCNEMIGRWAVIKRHNGAVNVSRATISVRAKVSRFLYGGIFWVCRNHVAS